MAEDAETLPSEAIGQPQPAGAAAPEEVGEHRALRGDPGGGRQDDGGVPRPQGHRAVHPGHHEYCKCYTHTRNPAGWARTPLHHPKCPGWESFSCEERDGDAVGESDVLQAGSGFSPGSEQCFGVKNPARLLLLLLGSGTPAAGEVNLACLTALQRVRAARTKAFL